MLNDMTLTINVKDDGVLTLLRDMERLDLFHVVTPNTVSPASAAASAAAPVVPARPKMTEAEEIEYINRNAEWLNREMEDVLSYQSLDL
jgi:hypothetical protein